MKPTHLRVALIGNPNSGKSTLFNALTGKHQEIGNWCGVTVEKMRGWYTSGEETVEVIDLPGCYQYLATEDSAADERITAGYLASNEADLIVNVVEATNLERHLYLTLQLLEQGFPVIVALNMMDTAAKEGIDIQVDALAKRLGCPVIPMTAAKKRGIIELQTAILAYAKNQTIFAPCFLTSALLNVKSDPIEYAKAHHEFIRHIIQGCVIRTEVKTSWTTRLDKIVLNRFLGIPIFFCFMYGMFIFAFQIGGGLQDYFDVSSKFLFMTEVERGLTFMNAPDWLIGVLAYGVGQGINTTVSFIPVIAGIFFALSFLESSGYMARAAFVMDKVMQWVGLPGKSFVPMIIGFGCNVPAVLATRTLENYRERILTILMSPFMSCGARLAIYALFAAAFFPKNGQNVIFGLYVIGILVALLTGWVLRTTVLTGESSALIIELPLYRWPSLLGLCKTTWQRLKRFILKAGMMIITLSVLIGGLGAIHHKTGMNNWLATVGRSLTPIFTPMGIAQDNWPATVGLLSGVLAKEVVVGTLNALYAEEERIALRTTVSQEGALGMMVERFGSTAAAFSYLLFVLLYFPCISVVATITRELNRSWAAFSVVWTTGIAYVTAVIFYQCATINEHPISGMTWIISMFTLLGLGFYGVRKAVRLKTARASRALPTQILIVDV